MDKKTINSIIEDILKGLDKSCIVTLTNPKGVITYANDLFCKISKYSESELIGKTHKIVNSGFHSTIFWRKLWNTISSGSVWRGELKNKAKDGSFYWTYATIIPQHDSDGTLIKYMAIRSDISQKKQSEKTQGELKNAIINSKNIEISNLQNKLHSSLENQLFLGNDPKITALFQNIKKVGATNYSVLIQGESGTGKELVAKMIHDESKRSNSLFLPIDAGSIPESLFESEFFGHLKGAFTDANENKKGYFETCHNGSLFLDEIGNLSIGLQSKLLRVLQEKEITPLGSSKSSKIDVRMIFATNTDLENDINKKTFREDLYHRISEYVIKIPPLRERGEDVLIIADVFLKNASTYLSKPLTFHPKVKDVLLNYQWPGNVRELKNKIRQAALTADHIVKPEHLFSYTKTRNKNLLIDKSANFSSKQNKTYENYFHHFEKSLFENVLKENEGNKLKSSTQLGMYYATFCRKLKKYNL
ncbi:sigma 54-interacting transcriptional regulator [bacterium]|jgi:two-component system, NtrC family, response regulator HydG|nr:sigma 54-interacting transcriptional regulator [bacterium]